MLPRHVWPFLEAAKVTRSVPARFVMRRSTLKEPLGPRVVAVPRAETEPLWTMRQL